MKIRHGFVSNSSTGSFIVKAWSQDQEKDLLDYGFIQSDDSYLHFKVTCNEDEVIDWLTQHGIPFKASCHYGHYTALFDGKELVTIENPGIVAYTYGLDILLNEAPKG